MATQAHVLALPRGSTFLEMLSTASSDLLDTEVPYFPKLLLLKDTSSLGLQFD